MYEVKESRKFKYNKDGVVASVFMEGPWSTISELPYIGQSFLAFTTALGNPVTSMPPMYLTDMDLYPKPRAENSYARADLTFSTNGYNYRQKTADLASSIRERLSTRKVTENIQDGMFYDYASRSWLNWKETFIADKGIIDTSEVEIPTLERFLVQPVYEFTMYGSNGYIKEILSSVGGVNSTNLLKNIYDRIKTVIPSYSSTSVTVTNDVSKWLLEDCSMQYVNSDLIQYDFVFLGVAGWDLSKRTWQTPNDIKGIQPYWEYDFWNNILTHMSLTNTPDVGWGSIQG